MIIGKRLKGKAIATWLGPTGDAARRAMAAVKQRVSGDAASANRLDVYLDIADAWSYLAAQIAQRLVKAYGVELGVTIVTPPAADVAPQPLLRPKHAVRDAQNLADYWDLEFPGKKEADSGIVRDVGTALIRERPAAEQLAAALELLTAMWIGDRKLVATLVGKYGFESHMAVPPILNEAYSSLRKAGHYQAGMFHFGGDWYSIERLPQLEEALAHATSRAIAHVVNVRPLAERGPRPLSDGNPKSGALRCEMWFSFRSPYSYLALEQIEGVLEGSGLPLVLRPVLPMVARGMEMPAVKRMYIVRDAKREADRLGIKFGELCDPLGTGVDNCIAIAHWAEQRGPHAALAFARSAMRGIWAEARDMTEYVDLKFVVERAALPWEEARAALGAQEAAMKWAGLAAKDLEVYGLWGVPSFRVGELVVWGQDRLPLIADRLRRHAAAPPPVVVATEPTAT
jgi:2-hydroxychromene-2-carboxylate isomerase